MVFLVGRLSITGGSALACYVIIDSLPAYYTQAPLIGPLVATLACSVLVFLLTGILITILGEARAGLSGLRIADKPTSRQGLPPLNKLPRTSIQFFPALTPKTDIPPPPPPPPPPPLRRGLGVPAHLLPRRHRDGGA